MNDSRQAMARAIGFACLATITAQLMAGVVDHAPLRRMVQTAPLWIGVVFGLRGADAARPAGGALLLAWLALTVGLPFAPGELRYALGDAFAEMGLASGFTAVAAMAGLLAALLKGRPGRVGQAGVLVVIVLLLQAGALAAALLPSVADSGSLVID